MHACIHTYIHTYTHTHTHTQLQADDQRQRKRRELEFERQKERQQQFLHAYGPTGLVIPAKANGNIAGFDSDSTNRAAVASSFDALMDRHNPDMNQEKPQKNSKISAGIRDSDYGQIRPLLAHAENLHIHTQNDSLPPLQQSSSSPSKKQGHLHFADDSPAKNRPYLPDKNNDKRDKNEMSHEQLQRRAVEERALEYKRELDAQVRIYPFVHVCMYACSFVYKRELDMYSFMYVCIHALFVRVVYLDAQVRMYAFMYVCMLAPLCKIHLT
jgi:hypothetical protein